MEGSTPVLPSRMFFKLQNPRQVSDTFFPTQQALKSCVTGRLVEYPHTSIESLVVEEEEEEEEGGLAVLLGTAGGCS